MKKFFVVLIVLLCLFSCKEQPNNTDTIPDEFNADVKILINGREYAAVYEKRNLSDRLVFSYPERLEGLCILLSDGVCTVTMGDVSFESESFKLMFDFLPVISECEKTVGDRMYKIYDIRGVE